MSANKIETFVASINEQEAQGRPLTQAQIRGLYLVRYQLKIPQSEREQLVQAHIARYGVSEVVPLHDSIGLDQATTLMAVFESRGIDPGVPIDEFRSQDFDPILRPFAARHYDTFIPNGLDFKSFLQLAVLSAAFTKAMQIYKGVSREANRISSLTPQERAMYPGRSFTLQMHLNAGRQVEDVTKAVTTVPVSSGLELGIPPDI